MSTSNITRILLIDDLEINHTMSTFIISRTLPKMEIVSFTKPVEALAYIKEEYKQGSTPTLLLLDINMPVMNGWQVLDMLESYDSAITEQLSIYVLSSSIDPRDKQQAVSAPKVLGFLERPLTPDMLQQVLSNLG